MVFIVLLPVQSGTGFESELNDNAGSANYGSNWPPARCVELTQLTWKENVRAWLNQWIRDQGGLQVRLAEVIPLEQQRLPG